MGQFHDSTMTTRVTFDEESDNGLIVGGKYLPEELLAGILCYIDYKSLLNCQLVCKRWKILIQSYVWRKKAEISLGRLLLLDQEIPWHTYYLICKKKPFERNLIKNNSGEHGRRKFWKILNERSGDGWKVENPPVGAPPLPSAEPVFEGKQFCFVTTFYSCAKTQMIDLEVEGLTPHILDKFQPPILVSEWYSCRWDCPAVYECAVKLLKQDYKILDIFQHRDDIEGDRQNQWHSVSHEFINYGPGLRTIEFYHGGKDKSFWAGHYGSKMAGACVYVKVPTAHFKNEENNALQDTD